MNMRAIPMLFVSISFLAAVPAARATSIVPMDLEQMVTASSRIVHGTVTSARSHWTEDHSTIVTDIRVQVAETFLGEPSGEVVVTQLGGKVGKLRVDVDGASVFRTGDEVVLFLAPDAQNHLQVTGFSQGRFDVTADPKTGAKQVTGLSAQRIALLGIQDMAPPAVTGLAEAPPAEAAAAETALLPEFLTGLRGFIEKTATKPKPKN